MVGDALALERIGLSAITQSRLSLAVRYELTRSSAVMVPGVR